MYVMKVLKEIKLKYEYFPDLYPFRLFNVFTSIPHFEKYKYGNHMLFTYVYIKGRFTDSLNLILLY